MRGTFGGMIGSLPAVPIAAMAMIPNTAYENFSWLENRPGDYRSRWWRWNFWVYFREFIVQLYGDRDQPMGQNNTAITILPVLCPGLASCLFDDFRPGTQSKG